MYPSANSWKDKPLGNFLKGKRKTFTEEVIKINASKVSPTAYNIRKGVKDKIVRSLGKFGSSPRISVTSDVEFLGT